MWIYFAAGNLESTKYNLEKQLGLLVNKYKQLEASRDDEITSAKSITDDAISSIQVSAVSFGYIK